MTMIPTAVPNGAAPARPTTEVTVGGPWAGYSAEGGYLVADRIDQVIRQFGPYVYEVMRHDPAIFGSLALLFAGVLAEGPRIEPAIKPEPGENPTGPKRREELRLAQEIADYWQFCIGNLDTDFDQILWEMLDESCCEGCGMAEPVYEVAEEGDWKDKLVLRSCQVKPRWAWGLLVDPFMRIRKFRVWSTQGWVDVDRNHFMFLSWMPRKGDPRGSRILRPAYPAWNLKYQAIPDYSEYLKKFATAKLILTAGEASQPTQRRNPVTGQIEDVKVTDQMVEAGKQFSNFGVMGLPFGATAQLVQSQGNGEPFLKGYDWADREIFRSIILGTRPMQEAKHSSKADSESGMDLIDMAVKQVRKPVGGAVRRDLLYWGTLLNWGKPIADRLTPHLGFGVTDRISSDLLNAFGDAWQKGVLQTPQRPWMLSKLGAPLDPPEAQMAAEAGHDGKQDQAGGGAQGAEGNDAEPAASEPPKRGPAKAGAKP